MSHGPPLAWIPGLRRLPNQRGRHGLGGERDTGSLPRAPVRGKAGGEEPWSNFGGPAPPRPGSSSRDAGVQPRRKALCFIFITQHAPAEAPSGLPGSAEFIYKGAEGIDSFSASPRILSGGPVREMLTAASRGPRGCETRRESRLGKRARISCALLGTLFGDSGPSRRRVRMPLPCRGAGCLAMGLWVQTAERAGEMRGDKRGSEPPAGWESQAAAVLPAAGSPCSLGQLLRALPAGPRVLAFRFPGLCVSVSVSAMTSDKTFRP